MAIKKTKKEVVVEAPPEVAEAPVSTTLVEAEAVARDISMMQVREEWGIAEDGSEDHLPEADPVTGEIFIGTGEPAAAEPVSQETDETAATMQDKGVGHNGGPAMDSPYKLADSTAELLGGFMERLQYQAQAMKDLKDANKATLAEAKSAGLDVNVLKSAMKQLEMSTEEREKAAKSRAEHEQMIDLYVLACEERV